MAAVPTAGAPSGTRSEQASEAPSAPVAEPSGSRPWHASLTDSTQSGSPWIVVGLWALLALPLVVALGVLHTKHWIPIGDIAQTELRVRDVWSRHPPLIGLAGRIGPFYHQGSHPGPLSFWSLWPVYRIFGETPMGLVASGTFLQLLAVGGALWLAFRRGGLRLVIGVAVILALLTRGYGSVTLTEPWNPFLPVMWWFLFLIAVWSVLCDDLVAFPIAVFAGSFCMETHISYLGLVGGLSLALVAGLVLAWRRRRDDAQRRREWFRWTVGGARARDRVVDPSGDRAVHDESRATDGHLAALQQSSRGRGRARQGGAAAARAAESVVVDQARNSVFSVRRSPVGWCWSHGPRQPSSHGDSVTARWSG